MVNRSGMDRGLFARCSVFSKHLTGSVNAIDGGSIEVVDQTCMAAQRATVSLMPGVVMRVINNYYGTDPGGERQMLLEKAGHYEYE